MEQTGAAKRIAEPLQAAVHVGADQVGDLHFQHLAAGEAAEALGHRVDVAQPFGRGIEEEQGVAGLLEEGAGQFGTVGVAHGGGSRAQCFAV